MSALIKQLNSFALTFSPTPRTTLTPRHTARHTISPPLASLHYFPRKKPDKGQTAARGALINRNPLAESFPARGTTRSRGAAFASKATLCPVWHPLEAAADRTEWFICRSVYRHTALSLVYTGGDVPRNKTNAKEFWSDCLNRSEEMFPISPSKIQSFSLLSTDNSADLNERNNHTYFSQVFLDLTNLFRHKNEGNIILMNRFG